MTFSIPRHGYGLDTWFSSARGAAGQIKNPVHILRDNKGDDAEDDDPGDGSGR